MSISLAAITVDCDDAAAVARFWSAALDRPLAADPEPSEDIALIGDLDAAAPAEPNWLFCKVPEGKTAKNRMHVDTVTADRPAEVARLVALGATLVGDKEEWGHAWTVLQDPEGNEFCVASA
jgi:predicted enzyme related to lactoylglutathione lyase